MRMPRLLVLALSISLLALGPAAHAREKAPPRPAVPRSAKAQTIVDPGTQPPVISLDTPDLGEYLLFFRHLAGVDAAADNAEAAGNAEAGQWRSLDQRAAGLTDEQGAILKQAAYGCNQALQDRDAAAQAAAGTPGAEPPGERMEVVGAAVDNLHALLGEEAFEQLDAYVHSLYDQVLVTSGGHGPPLPVGSAPTGGGDVDPPVTTESVPTLGISARVVKFDGTQVAAECDTSPEDGQITNGNYVSTITTCSVEGNGAPASVPCDQIFPGYCLGPVPASAGRTYTAHGVHGLIMYPVQCPTEFGDVLGLDDPFHFGYPPGYPLRSVQGFERFYPLGPPVCWPVSSPNNSYALAVSESLPVTYIDVNPHEVTLRAGGQQQFTSNIPAYWFVDGAGTVDSTGRYTAPPTISFPGTAKVVACDASTLPELVDCTRATVNLQAFTVEVTPSITEMLPDTFTTFFVNVNPSAPGQSVEWSLSTDAGDPTGRFTATGNTAANYTAPKNDEMPVTEQITIKACVRPDANSQPVCGTAQVIVPKFQMYVVADKKTLFTGESEHFTAFVNTTSATFRKIDWIAEAAQFKGTFTVISDDTLQADYKAPDFVSSVTIKVCLKESPSTCSAPTYPFLLQIVNPVQLTGVTPSTLNAGETAHFTISGSGFGLHPGVQFPSLQASVLSSSDSLIDGLVIIPVSAGGTTKPSVTVNYPNGDSFFINWPTPIPIARASVQVVPPTAQLHAGESQQFSAICLTASAAACTSPDPASWQASTGTVDPTGKYTAPATVTTSTTATVKACWGGVVCATAQVTLLPPDAAPVVTVSPKTVTLQAGRTQQFTAQVTGSTNTGVTWSLNPSTPDAGSISQTGLYTAPAALGSVTTVTVVATSQADSTKQGTATVTLTPPPPQPTVTITPSPAAAVHGTALTWTAHASGGEPATLQYAFFRRRVGTSPWTPDVTTPAWQTSNVYTWIPASTDVGTWEIVVWVRDGNTPANANTYGYAASANAGPVRIVAPLSITVTPSPSPAPYGSPITWTVTANGGDTVTLQYALFRRRAGTTSWTPDVTAPAWQTSNVLTWTPAAADAGTWEILVEAKDITTPANSNPSVNPGPVVVAAPLSLTVTPSPAYSTAGNAITWTATASGGDAATIRYAFFRRRAGTTPWTPDVTAPNWQAGNAFTWTPASAETGTWEIVVWVKDGTTPANANIYGYATYANAGPVQVVAPLTLTSTPTSPTVVTYGTPFTWTVSSTGGVPGTVQYTLARQLSGTSNWLPSPLVFQSSNVMTWTPTAADVGTWTIGIGVRDSLTSPTANGFGVAASALPGAVKVVAPLGLSVTPSPASSTSGTTLNWTATATGGDSATIQYAFFRRRAGTTPWTPDVTAPNWQTSNVFHWTPAAADAGTWEVVIWAKDASTAANTNTYGYSAYANAGPVQVYNPITVTGTGSPSSAYYGNTLNWTANPSGGTAGTFKHAFFRRRLGTTPWTPDVTAPNWQTSNVLSWAPTSADIGTWEIIIWVKDANTPATQNTYGYGAYYNAGPVLITAPMSLSITPSPSSSQYGTAITWTATASGGNPSTTQYAFFQRRAGTTPWAPDVTAPNWQSSNTFTWTPTSNDVATWEIVIWVKDGATPSTMNTYGYAAYANAGPVQVTAPPPLTVTGTGSPSASQYGHTLTWTATASGGVPSSRQYALFRRLSGTSAWTPDVTAPNWQSSNVLSWTPTAADTGTWEIIIWVKDGTTPSTLNTYGFAAYYNAGPVQITN